MAKDGAWPSVESWIRGRAKGQDPPRRLNTEPGPATGQRASVPPTGGLFVPPLVLTMMLLFPTPNPCNTLLLSDAPLPNFSPESDSA